MERILLKNQFLPRKRKGIPFKSMTGVSHVQKVSFGWIISWVGSLSPVTDGISGFNMSFTASHSQPPHCSSSSSWRNIFGMLVVHPS